MNQNAESGPGEGGNSGLKVDRLRRTGIWWLVVVLLVIAIAAAATIAFTWGPDLKRETGKAALSVLAASVFGTLVTLVVDRYRRDRDRRDDEREDARRLAADDRIRAAENARREAERQHDDRQRQDAQLRAMLEQTFATYNSVKESRRLLKAHCTRATKQAIQLEMYDAYMQELIRLQLRLEEFKRVARVEPDRLGIGETASGYRQMEHYLNEIIDEYIENRHKLKVGDDYWLTALPRLEGFLRSHLRDRDGHEIGFNSHMSDQIGHIVRVIQGQLLRPSQFTDRNPKSSATFATGPANVGR